MNKKTAPLDFIKFLGTAGARFVVIKQMRYSAGIWVSYCGTNIIIDPGPGSLLRCYQSRPKLNPLKLDGIILTHRHIDHSNDVNIMAEAMSEGGFKKKGVLFCPQDCLGPAGVVFDYVRQYLARVKILKIGSFSCGRVRFSAVVKNRHSVETYGLKLHFNGLTVGFSSDTEYFSELGKVYAGCDILVLNVVSFRRRPGVQHLCLEDAQELIKSAQPKKAVLTHFGMAVLKARPHILEAEMRKFLGKEVIFAYDGFTLEI